MWRYYLRLLRSSPRWRSIGVPVLVVITLSVLAGISVSFVLRRAESPGQRADRFVSMGEYSSAEVLLWQVLQAGDADLETVIAFIDNHRRLQAYDAAALDLPPMKVSESLVSDQEIEAFLHSDRLIGSDAVLARFWWQTVGMQSEDHSQAARDLAGAEPPARWANHLLGRLLLMADDHQGAAVHFEREGLSFPVEASDDLERALALWMMTDQWQEVRSRLDDPRWAPVISAPIRLAVAEHDRDWPAVLLWLWPSGLGGAQPWPWALALVSGVLWFLLAARMGKMGSKDQVRKLLYLAAFALGVLSIYPTLVLVVLEETFFNLTPDGQPIVDAIYYVFGVGLREELCKLLLFLPLLPLIRRRQSRLEALVCGALVGLGFAAEENIGYFHSMAVSTALARFLTANFLHMALTALIAVSIYDGSSARKGEDFATVFPLAVLLHGAYDFFLASPSVAMEFGFLAMTVFVFLSQRFLRELKVVRPSRRSAGLLRQFVLSLAVLSGVSYIYACTLIGPLMAFTLIGSGLLGVAILMIMFVRELEDA